MNYEERNPYFSTFIKKQVDFYPKYIVIRELLISLSRMLTETQTETPNEKHKRMLRIMAIINNKNLKQRHWSP